MRVFFSLAGAVDAKDKAYRQGVVALGKTMGFTPVFADEAPSDKRVEWITDRLDECDFAFFDVTERDADGLVTLGLGLDSETRCYPLASSLEGLKLSKMLENVREYFGGEDFQRKVRTIITETQGADVVRKRELIERIKRKVASLGPLPLRQIAQELGYHPAELRPVVYSMVAESSLTKQSDKRWARYALPS
ncbi:MAG: hypothetical protein AB7J28_14755 [Hyphomonadaceae bacterium]